MPEEHYVWLPKPSLLTFEELARVARIFAGTGVTKLRLTGGEPLLRHGLPDLVTLLRGVDGIDELTLTTNGLLLERSAAELRAAGLDRVTVSLDTLRPDRFRELAGRGRHADVLQGIRAAADAGFSGTKVNAVIVRTVNDDEVVDLIAFGRAEQVEVRLIEYMDVGGATQWQPDRVVSRAEMLETIAAAHGPVTPVPPTDRAAPAERYRLADGTCFGIIASTTAPFCGACDRSRVTADGMWFRCLYAQEGTDLRALLRDGTSDADVAMLVRSTWAERADRGAEARLGLESRGPLYALDGLRVDPHREMHTRGG
jgi:cyclic pyranopterin phosphate synthase